MKREPKPFGHSNPKLKLWIEWVNTPNKQFFQRKIERFAIWNLERLSLTSQEVEIDFDINWKFNPKITHLLLGKEVVRKTIGNLYRGAYDRYLHGRVRNLNVFITSSFGGALGGPQETYKISRTLFLAAQAAELSPEINFNLAISDDYIARSNW